MTLNRKITLLMVAVNLVILAMLVAISLYAFRTFAIASSTAHVQTAAEIVRLHLTEAMINGVIDKREQFLDRLLEVHDLHRARVVRSPHVIQQFGEGLARERDTDAIEALVLGDGRSRFELTENDGEPLFRGTIPYIATAHGKPNCLQCHQVSEGTVLGAVTIELSLSDLQRRAIEGVLAVILSIGVISLIAVLAARRLILPVGDTANALGQIVQRALSGDFKGRVTQRTKDDIGEIAIQINRLLSFLEQGLSRISSRVAQLTGRPSRQGDNQLQATIDMVEGLADAASFKTAIEEDETKTEIYDRFGRLLDTRFGMSHFSIYETNGPKQLVAAIVDGEIGGACRWCDEQILVRSDTCRAKRSGLTVDGLRYPGLCYAFRPRSTTEREYRHYCIPIIQSGTVGSVIQLVTDALEAPALLDKIPYIQVYLREMAPVLVAKRLTETLRDLSLRDAVTGLNNRRFLEEYLDTLTATTQRHNSTLALLMIDLDHFKMVNDTYGHDVGDAVLKSLAYILKQSRRASDLVIRFGGEEFLIILPESDEAGALTVAEKIRASVAAFKFQVDGAILQKTVSIGVAIFPDDSATFWQTLKYADVALYRAKEDGRDRVVRFTPDMWQTPNGAD